ncbi:hypothetical protein EDB86DRAFT_2828528 [Lactarius hatsudake]|nr:hypothetical protein EDB86DRAFT_2828528 [Lactarius hatsudake]
MREMGVVTCWVSGAKLEVAVGHTELVVGKKGRQGNSMGRRKWHGKDGITGKGRCGITGCRIGNSSPSAQTWVKEAVVQEVGRVVWSAGWHVGVAVGCFDSQCTVSAAPGHIQRVTCDMVPKEVGAAKAWRGDSSMQKWWWRHALASEVTSVVTNGAGL